MCFSNRKKSSSTAPATTDPMDPRAFYQWWRPPQIDQPTLQLNDDALGRKEIQSKRLGKRRLQIPLAPGAGSSGLSINQKRN